MGLLDKAKDMIAGNSEKVSEMKTKAADMVDEKTGGKYADKIDKVEDMADKGIDKLADGQDAVGDAASGATDAAGDAASGAAGAAGDAAPGAAGDAVS